MILLALATVCVSCKKSSMDETASLEGMTFSASTVPTKSHFNPESTTDLTLYWDEYDDLAVYSIDPSNPSSEAVSGLALIKSGVGSTSAQFKSTKPKGEWFPGGQSRHFFTYYPCNAYPLNMDNVDGEQVLPVFLPQRQDGENYGKYHVMVASGDEFSPSAEKVVFSNFKPVTSLLKFRLVPDEDYAFNLDYIYLQSYWVSSETADDFWWEYNSGGVWKLPADLTGLHYLKVSDITSGAALLPHNYVGYINTRDTRMSSRLTIQGEEDGFYEMSGSSRDLYAVVFPTDEYPDRGMLALKVSASYSINVSGVGSIQHEAYIRIPAPGFQAGKRYDFVLTVTSAGMLIDSDQSTSWGYDVVQW